MGASAAAAVILIKEKHIVEAFRDAGATDASAAVAPAALGVDERLAFRKLRRRTVLRDAGDGRYYLDEQAWKDLRQRRHRRVLVMTVVMAVVTLAAAITLAVVARR